MPAMRYFRKQKMIEFKTKTGTDMSEGGGKPLTMTMDDWFANQISNDDRFKKNMSTLRQSDRVASCTLGVKEGDICQLEEADWELACEAIKDPKVSFNGPGGTITTGFDMPMVARQKLPFMEATLNAKQSIADVPALAEEKEA